MAENIKSDAKMMSLSFGNRHFDILRQLLDVARELEYELTSKLSYFDLSNGKLKVLLSLLKHEKPLNPSELAEDAGVTRSTMTGLLDGLEKEGFIRRSTLEDRRKTAIYLTEKGKGILNTLIPLYNGHVSKIFSKTSEEEQQLLMNLFVKIKDGLQDAKEHNDFPI
ncbi:MarR family transcriptional regulator [Bacillus salipaludis]|uniref:MarR family winged helix-turn-helix transcriptional regulator n=1 Tax=Bacillus salipaludis TaxID=2547811 RepID=UPI003D1D3222